MKTLQQLHEFIINSNVALLQDTLQQKQTTENPISVSIFFLRNFAINPIEDFLKFYLYETGFKPEIVFGSYDSVRQDILDPGSALYQKEFDVIVCALFYHPMDARFLNSLHDTKSFIDELALSFKLILEKTNGLILVNTFVPPFFSETGITLPPDAKNYADSILEINQFIRHFVRQHAGRFFLMDWVRYVQILGEFNSIDYRYWYMYQAPFKKGFLSLYANDITKAIRARHGFAKKCLILDCDNTLWGGIIGEDGLSGIKLDNHDSPGKIFYDFQKTVLSLAEKGIILTLCSKNNEQDVWEVFERHPHALLRRSHFANYRINWEAKTNNIIEMINELNIGVDSCVFIDDSETECELIKLALPDLTVICVPKTLYEYPILLLKEGFFSNLTHSKEDANRNQQYQQETARQKLLRNTQDFTHYLASLELVVDIHTIKPEEISRITQLTQKTNQFNLSTKRYSQTEIENFIKSEDNAIFSLQVVDKFGNYGLTGVFIGNRCQNKGFIDTFLMSCRILSRNLEFAFLQYCLKKLSCLWNVSNWEAEFVPTAKNGQIENFLMKAGFQKMRENLFQVNINELSANHIDHIQYAKEQV